MEERAKHKRKLRELEHEAEQDQDDDFEAPEGVDLEHPRQGLKEKKAAQPSKKQKRDGDEGEDEGDWEDEKDEPKTNGEGAKTKLSKKEAKKVAKIQKRKDKKAKKAESKTKGTDIQEGPDGEDAPAEHTKQDESKSSSKKNKSIAPSKKSKPDEPTEETDDDDNDEDEDGAAEVDHGVQFTGLQPEADSQHSDSEPHSPTFDTHTSTTPADQASASTSISSTVPPSEKPKHIKIPNDTSALRARLAAKIEALRAARKADGPDGKPIRTRQELIESRRVKQAQRKAHKKELRNKAKLEEERKREEALASNSPSVMSPAVELDERAGNFSFGRVAFGDGSQLSHDLSYVLSNGKRKGPSDPKTALLKVQAQKQRMEELDPEKRKDIAEKEAWLKARRRVEGEKIRDDEATLKKTIKRKEVAKKKSEKAWKDRQKGVDYAQKERQKKREENLKKRREEKMSKGGKKKGGAGGAKKKGRPGFEGSSLGGGGGGRRK